MFSIRVISLTNFYFFLFSFPFFSLSFHPLYMDSLSGWTSSARARGVWEKTSTNFWAAAVGRRPRYAGKSGIDCRTEACSGVCATQTSTRTPRLHVRSIAKPWLNSENELRRWAQRKREVWEKERENLPLTVVVFSLSSSPLPSSSASLDSSTQLLPPSHVPPRGRMPVRRGINYGLSFGSLVAPSVLKMRSTKRPLPQHPHHAIKWESTFLHRPNSPKG